LLPTLALLLSSSVRTTNKMKMQEVVMRRRRGRVFCKVFPEHSKPSDVKITECSEEGYESCPLGLSCARSKRATLALQSSSGHRKSPSHRQRQKIIDELSLSLWPESLFFEPTQQIY